LKHIAVASDSQHDNCERWPDLYALRRLQRSKTFCERVAGWFPKDLLSDDNNRVYGKLPPKDKAPEKVLATAWLFYVTQSAPPRPPPRSKNFGEFLIKAIDFFYLTSKNKKWCTLLLSYGITTSDDKKPFFCIFRSLVSSENVSFKNSGIEVLKRVTKNSGLKIVLNLYR
jgi:hypothetical protein